MFYEFRQYTTKKGKSRRRTASRRGRARARITPSAEAARIIRQASAVSGSACRAKRTLPRMLNVAHKEEAAIAWR